MQTSPKHIIFFAEAVTLAHLARCISLANALVKLNYRVTLAADSRFNSLVGELQFPQIDLHSVSSAYFSAKLAQGLPLYSAKILCDYVEADIKILKQFKPDFIIGDFRLSLAISSRLVNIPYATITNAYWSPYADIGYPIPELPLTKLCGVALSQKLFNLVRPLIFRIHSLAFNSASKKFGLSTLKSDMREIYTHADYTLYADPEDMVPMKSLPSNHIFIGPVLWSASATMPDWWETLPASKPIIFVTLGSSGESRLLPMILETLSQLPLTVIAVTAKKTLLAKTYANVFVAEFLPADLAVKKADMVICNGGSPMVYQCLAEDKAVLCIPSNLDQYLMTSVLENAGRGKMIRAGKANPRNIREAVNQMLANKAEVGDTGARYSLAIDKITKLINAV
jgi:UDP:flavonoid glycosyltransferase YjiC (YdhE family)